MSYQDNLENTKQEFLAKQKILIKYITDAKSTLDPTDAQNMPIMEGEVA